MRKWMQNHLENYYIQYKHKVIKILVNQAFIAYALRLAQGPLTYFLSSQNTSEDVLHEDHVTPDPILLMRNWRQKSMWLKSAPKFYPFIDCSSQFSIKPDIKLQPSEKFHHGRPMKKTGQIKGENFILRVQLPLWFSAWLT